MTDTIVKLPNLDPSEQLTLGQGFNLIGLAPVQYNILGPKFDKAVLSRVESSETFFSSNENSEDKMNKFHLDGHLKVGVLFGLLSCGADFHFLRINKTNNRTVRGVLMYRFETRQETVVIDHVIGHLKTSKILTEETDSTHVITKIVYGGYVSCTFEYDVKEHENIFEIEGKLNASLNVILASVDASGAAGYNAESHSFLSNTKMEIKGTFIHSKVIPADPRAVIDYFRAIPSLINKDSMNHVRYELTSLDAIRRKLSTTYLNNTLVTKMSDEMAARILSSMDDVMRMLKTASNELRIAKSSKHKDLMPVEKWEAEVCKIDAAMDKMIKRVKRCMQEQDFDDADEEMVKESPKIRLSCNNFIEACKSRRKFVEFVVDVLYPGVQVFKNSREADNAVSVHLAKYPSGRVILYTEDYARSVQTESRSIMGNLIQKHVKSESVEFIICLEPIPLMQSIQCVDEFHDAKEHLDDINQENICCDCVTNCKLHCKSHIVAKEMNGNIIVDIHPYEIEKECQVFVSPLVRVAEGERIKTDDDLAARLNLKNMILRCQGQKCSSKPIEWRCEECCEVVQFDKDNFLYCRCYAGSKFPLHSTKFRCSPSQGTESHPWEQCRKETTLADVNVLIVGASGIGKSTLINSFINYYLFEDFDDAMRNSSELVIPIPGEFTASGFGRRDADGQLIREDQSVVKFGDQSKATNENVNNRGQSVTQFCKTYTITLYNRQINFIDPPGMLDSRGPEQDKVNSDHIVSYISSLSHLSAVLFVMKPNEERLTAPIMYTFLETFARLNKDLANNIYFLFTVSSTTNYALGGTHNTIVELQEQLSTKERKLKLLQQDKQFFVDNAGFRLVCAKAAGLELFNDEDGSLTAGNRTHWARSSKACRSLIESLLSASQVATLGIKKLNETKLLIASISDVLVKVSKNCDATLASIEAKENEVKLAETKGEDLEDQLNVTVRRCKVVQLNEPMTVCTSATCCEVVEVFNGVVTAGNEMKYKACHKPCYLEGVTLNQVNHPLMKYCLAFRREANCYVCAARGHTCGTDKHMHMLTDIETYLEDCEVATVRSDLDALVAKKTQYITAINGLEMLKRELISEKDIIIKSMAKFAKFIKRESLVVPNDRVLDYLRQTISVYEGKPNLEPDQVKELENTKKILASYQQQMKLLDDADKNGGSNVESVALNNVDKELEALFALKHTGKEIKDSLQSFKRIQQTHPVGDKSSTTREYIPLERKKRRWGMRSVVNNAMYALEYLGNPSGQMF
ncbi:hypothetical protein HDU79_004604 [Rhizoclosmatium sp. JEL0117]|nr:hypothetical protein HDU79_004604 [Rhizoclosmatium sp. JEL0117]